MAGYRGEALVDAGMAAFLVIEMCPVVLVWAAAAQKEIDECPLLSAARLIADRQLPAHLRFRLPILKGLIRVVEAWYRVTVSLPRCLSR